MSLNAASAAPMRLPLDQFCTLRSNDAQRVQEYMGRCFSPHQLRLQSPSQALDVRLNQVDLGQVSLHVLRYGAQVMIDPGERGDFYMLQIPLSGSADVRSGSSQVQVRSSVMGILHPHAPTVMHWSPNCTMLLLCASREVIHERLDMGQRSHQMPVRMAATRQDPRVNAWWRATNDLVMNLDAHPHNWLEHAPAKTALQEFLLAGFADMLSASCGGDPHAHSVGADHQALARAKEFIHAHLDRPVRLHDVAEHAKVSPRTLEALFQRHESMPPLTYAKTQRLHAAHLALQRDPGQSVTEVALSHGFGHLGRFASQYRQTFGCTPSETLRQHQA